MSKQRFMEFYLKALLRAVTGDPDLQASYAYYDLAHTEIMRIAWRGDHGGGVREIPVTGCSLLEITEKAIEQVKGM